MNNSEQYSRLEVAVFLPCHSLEDLSEWIEDDDELDLPFDGPTRFEGLELGGEISCNPRALRDGYLQAMEQFLGEVRHRSAASQCDYQLVRTSQAVDKTLVNFLSRRSKTRGRS